MAPKTKWSLKLLDPEDLSKVLVEDTYPSIVAMVIKINEIFHDRSQFQLKKSSIYAITSNNYVLPKKKLHRSSYILITKIKEPPAEAE